ncbi:MAG: long-chain-fatty-acid--CoA ligase [Acidimicrobiales bacterium]
MSLAPLPATVADIVRRFGKERADSPALTFVDGDKATSQSYAELDRRSSQTANALIDAGVTNGERVAILAQNSPLFFELGFAVSKIGAALVGLNWRLASPEIETIVADAQPTVLLVDPELDHLVTDGVRATAGLTIHGIGRWDQLVDAAHDEDPQLAVDPDDTVFILYTSGTTGLPKGAQLTNRNMVHSTWIAGVPYEMTQDSINLVSMPLFHVGGMGYGLSAFCHGGHTVLRRDADPAAIVDNLATHGVTHTFLVPAVVQMLLDVPGIGDADLGHLQLLVYGAAPIGEAVLRRAIEVLGCGFMQAYGMTETAGTVVTLPPEAHDPDGPQAGLLRSCGKPLPWVELRLVDPASIAAGEPADVAVGEVGEIWTRSAQNTPGYRNRPEATAEAITSDGWLRTGDAAYADAEGYLFLFDRFKDMIVSGGENVYPAEVENVIYELPGVSEVAVIGVPDERWGETVKAIVVAKPDETVEFDQLVELCRSRLARFKCPTSMDVVDALPRNASGKVLKTTLRAPFWQGHDRRIS